MSRRDYGRITVINKFKTRVGQNYIYCGRPSILGNPFKMKDNSKEERDRVCDEYERYFNKAIHHDEDLRVAVDRLVHLVSKGERLELACFCKPQRCHVETIQRYVHARVDYLRQERNKACRKIEE